MFPASLPKTIVTVGLVISSAIAGYVLWTHFKQEKKRTTSDDEESKESKESKE